MNSKPDNHIEGTDTSGRSVIPVATAVPCFVGFTEKAVNRNNQPVPETLVKIKSLGDYITIFGAAPPTKFKVTLKEDGTIHVTPNEPYFYLFNSLKLYFANGGGDCYIFSVGDYTETSFKSEQFTKKVLKSLETEPEPTLIVMPDAHLIKNSADYYSIWQEVLPHCKKMINRFALLDIHNGGDISNISNRDKAAELIQQFREHIGTRDLAFGAAYWPWIQATVLQPNDIGLSNIDNFENLKKDLKKQIDEIFPPQGETLNTKGEEIKEFIEGVDTTKLDDIEFKPHGILMQVSPLYKKVLNNIREAANIMPASGAMAGIYKYVDNDKGTFQSPANISVSAVAKPLLTIHDHDQENLNIPMDGKAINVIRTFPGKGTLVWGARTMDGNSQDWRYISVRRTVSMIELSIKYAAEAYVFEPNASSTWSNVQSMISNFLTNMWQGGALAGTTAAEAFSVNVGLGSTMTAVDILDGYMNIEVKVAVTRPAEFIVITFQQQMQAS